jgi:hypothetical protein
MRRGESEISRTQKVLLKILFTVAVASAAKCSDED